MRLHWTYIPILFLLWATACTGGKSQNSPAQSEPYIKAIYALPRTLDPVLMNDTASLMVSNLLYDGLLRFTPDLGFEGALAESWSLDQDGRRYVFKLRSGLRFHDGSAITPEAVVRSLTRAVSPKSTVFKYYDCIQGAEDYFAGRARSVAGLKADGPNRVVIELKYPFPPFLSVLAGATAKVLPINADQDPGFFNRPIGSGPFQFAQLKTSAGSEGELLLTAFDHYQAGVPKVKTLTLRAMSEAKAMQEAQAGRVHDLANFPLGGNEPVFKAGRDASTPVAATWVIGLNVRKAPFNDLKLRQSFKAAIDGEAFRTAFYPDAVAAPGYIPSGLPGFLREPVQLKLGARSAPLEAITVAVPEVLSREKEIREFLEARLRKQGWSVTFVSMAWDKLMEGYDKKTLQAFLVSMNMDYPDTEFLIRNFETGNPDNFSGLSDPALDRLIRKARGSTDRLTRNALYQEVARRLEQLAVTVNLFHPRAHNWVHRCVKGFVPNVLADYYIDYRGVELDQECLASAGGGK
jgi:ABC-type transport system substrate-binding protein